MAKIVMKGVVLISVLHAFIGVGVGCEIGYYADTGTCFPCPEHCTVCSSASSCDSCSAGYFGRSCSQMCPQYCHDNECNKTSGVCLSCSKGYYSDKNICEKCPENCTTCNSPQYCFACKIGYKGKACEEKCTTCRPGTSCDKQTGYCLESCNAGRSGELCTVNCDIKCTFCERSNERACISCAYNRFGDSCNNVCSQKCLNQTCRDSDGECTYREREENPSTCGSHLSTGTTTIVIIFGILELIFIVVIVGFCIVYRNRIRIFIPKECCIAYEQFSLCKGNADQAESNVPESVPLKPGDKTEITNVATASSQYATTADVYKEDGREPQQINISGKVFENKGSVLVNDDNSADIGTYFITTNPPSKWDYITSSEPTEALLNDDAEIWKIILDEGCSIIILLTSLVEKEDILKLDEYLKNREKHKNINFLCDRGQNYTDYAVNKLTVKRITEERSDERDVFLFRYLAWPDKWDADTFLSLLKFHECVNAAKTDLDGPTLVHSSVGVHRFTTYIVFDMLIKERKYENPYDVRVCLQHLNRQRLQTNLEETEFLIQMLLQPPPENIKHEDVTSEPLTSNTVSTEMKLKRPKGINRLRALFKNK